MEIDADLSDLAMEMKHVTSLINPAKTYMVIYFSQYFIFVEVSDIV